MPDLTLIRGVPVLRPRGRLPLLVLLQLAAALLAAWSGTGQVGFVALAAGLLVGGLLFFPRSGRSSGVGHALLFLAVLAAFGSERHLRDLARGWPERAANWEVEIQSQLSRDLDRLIAEADAAAGRLAGEWGAGSIGSLPVLPESLLGAGVDALALFGPQGELVGWTGRHQGPLPEGARSATSRYLFVDGPLFSYLYATRLLPGGEGTAVAAVLLRSELPPALDPPGDDFQARFQSRTGAKIEVARVDRAVGERVWDLRWGDEILLSVSIPQPSEGEARTRIELRWLRLVALLLLLGWGASVVGVRGDARAALWSALTLLGTLLLLPLGRILGAEGIFSPADFLLPGPLELTLGDLLVLVLGATLLLGLLPWLRLPRAPPLVSIPLGVAGAWGGLRLLEGGASRDFLAGAEGGWVAFQGVGVGLLLLLLGIPLVASRRGGEEGARARPLAVLLWIGTALLLAAGAVFWEDGTPGLPSWLLFLWMIPLWGLARSLPTGSDWPSGIVRWIAVGLLAVTAVLPWAWGIRVEARIAVAEEQVDRLGTRADPFLEFLLLRAVDQARAFSDEGRTSVEVLYRTWSSSGLAWEGVPLWITYWSRDGLPQEELRIGVTASRPALPGTFLESTLIEGESHLLRYDLADLHYLALAPLGGGAGISILIPPRRVLSEASPLGPLFSPARGGREPLVLVPLLPGEAPGGTEGIHWMRTSDGWQGETFLAYPDEVYHAHYRLELPGPVLLLARATLLLLLNLSVLALLWAIGRWMGEGGRGALVGWFRALTSFRGRVTLALFSFFLIPSILFGTLAYQTLAGATSRTAEALAGRAVEDAAAWFPETAGAIDLLARRVGSDLLLYEGGELVGGSLPELVELGLYEGWLPPAIHGSMAGGEELVATGLATLGGWEYVVAYRRMAGGRVLAAPAPLQAGATALRQREVADLIGFSVTMGALLSILLSLLVGQALVRPIQTLRVASERVGAGNMSVRLPEDRSDEFGAVFDAFNRMVDRLAHARKALTRSSRRTRAIMEEVATGVIALDGQGRVALANRKAEELLGSPLDPHRPLDEGDGGGEPRRILATWLEETFLGGMGEGVTELTVGQRRIRVRARRVSRKGAGGGVVLSMEDVTDELRSERILAWGEMAQQVAHEVKNPLTPIKLGIQHIRRAWEDQSPNYAEILRRNVDAILLEIDRLAGIATSFSRYAAPASQGSAPLEAVDLLQITGEVMELYRAGVGEASFVCNVAGGVPAVQARPGEMKEVLFNLLENARSALGESGKVSVLVESIPGEEGGEEEGVLLRVRDDGMGIAPELLPRVFEPHFSTRSSGTGLGLAIVYRLVESWGGSIELASQVGEGTEIRIRLLPWRGAISEEAAG